MLKGGFLLPLLVVGVILGCKKEEKKQGTPADEMTVSVPEVLTVLPAGPSTDNFPIVSGTAQPLTLIRIYSDSTCSTQIGIGNSNASGNYSVMGQVADNTTTTIYARSFNGSFSSGCSESSVTYVETSNPATLEVVFTTTNPTSPGSSLAPQILGVADPLITVYLYTTSNCSTAAVASTVSDASGNFSIATTVGAGSTTTYYGRSMDGSGTFTPCSSDSITYTHLDVTPPPMPVITSINPVGPANNNAPVISGTAEASSTIKFYTNNTCTSAVAGSGTTDASGNFAIGITVADNSTATYYATATDASNNVSSCSTTNVSYTEDSTVPNVPVFTGTTPPSPGMSLTPVISGTADASTVIKLFTTTDCSGSPVYTTTATVGGNFSVNATVAASSTTTWYATATDSALNVSACTSTPISYTQGDATPPNAPVITSINPVGPANYNAPVISGTGEPNSTVKFYTDSGCSSAVAGSGSIDGAGSFAVAVTVVDDTSYTFWATATDASNNESACSATSISYVEDSTLPAVPVFTGTNPVSPSESLSTVISGTADPNVTVKLFTTTDCSGAAVYTTTSTAGGAFSVNATVTTLSTNTWYATATDGALNVSACTVTPITYQHVDVTAPTRPTISGITPVGPSDINTPEVEGSAEPNSTIKAYTNNTCTSTIVGTDTADVGGSFSVAVNAVDNTTTSYWVTATDSSNNVSPCSTTTVSYTAYSIPEGMGWFTGTTTSAPSTNTNINQSTAYSMQWSTGEFHSTYYSHSSSSNSHQVTVKVSGDYHLNFTIPFTAATAGTSIRAEVRVNGAVVENGRGESGYIGATNGHQESSLHLATLLPSLTANDVIDVTVIQAGAAATATVTGLASMSVEYVDPTKNIFFAKGTRTTNSTNLNQATGYPIQWTHSVMDGIYAHDDSTNSQNITINSNGNYLVYVNIPVTGTTANTNIKMTAKINGAALTYGYASQGVIRASGHTSSSVHWVGMLPNVASGAVLTIETALEGAAGTINVPASTKASIYLEQISPTGLFFARGTTLVTNNNWNNNTTGQNARWTSVDANDSSQYTHSTSSNPDRITLAQAGDYFLGLNIPLTSAGNNSNVAARVRVSGTAESGAITKSAYASGTSGNTDSSNALTFLFRKKTASQYLDVNAYREAANATVSSSGDASLFIIYKPNSIYP